MTTRLAPPPNDGEEFDTLLVRYWLGEASPDETAHIEAWFASNPGEREWYTQLHRGIQEPPCGGLTPSATAERTVKILQEAKIVPDPLRRQSSRAERRLPVRYIMATLVACVVLFVATWQFRPHASVSPGVSTYTTGNAERATVTLPDGSVALLNVASRLEVPADYATGQRTVRLTGEALFTVEHQKNAPFSVVSGSSVTRVLGTRFVVREYRSDTAALVSVLDGKVAVGPTVVTAGYEAMVGSMRTLHREIVDTNSFSFIRGVMFLDALPLHEAIPQLNRWYDADIRLADPALAGQRIIGSFEAGSITDLMWILQKTYHVRVVRDGRVLTLYPQG